MTAKEIKQAEKILDKYYMDGSISTYKACIKSMIEFASIKVAEATKELYPKEFVWWYVTKAQFEHSFRSDNMSPLDGAFEYWKQNIGK